MISDRAPNDVFTRAKIANGEDGGGTHFDKVADDDGVVESGPDCQGMGSARDVVQEEHDVACRGHERFRHEVRRRASHLNLNGAGGRGRCFLGS